MQQLSKIHRHELSQVIMTKCVVHFSYYFYLYICLGKKLEKYPGVENCNFFKMYYVTYFHTALDEP